MSSLIVEVCKIKEIIEHGNADRLEVAIVKGWNVIIQKGQYNVGDLVIFIPPDSIMPQSLIDKFQLDYLKKGERVRTVKLRGVLSQGLLLPVDAISSRPGFMHEGDDVAEWLGITKWSPPEPSYSPRSGGRIPSKKHLNPLFDKYTDIENIKNYPDVFQEGEMVYVTEKLHGCNARFGNLEIHVNWDAGFWYGLRSWFQKYILGRTHEFVYGSHNVQLSGADKNNFYGQDVWGQVAKDYDLANVLPKDYIFYGEIVGEGIQDLTYGYKAHRLYIFDVKDTKTGMYLDFHKVIAILSNVGIEPVPCLHSYAYTKDRILEATSGRSQIYSDQIREGVVVRPWDETNDKHIGRKILKSISPDYLLRKNGTEFQ